MINSKGCFKTIFGKHAGFHINSGVVYKYIKLFKFCFYFFGSQTHLF